MNKKGLPIGTDDFKKIITNNFYYIDKTKFIEDLCNNFSEINLFTRPRRFGKTLNMSMLKYFFDIKNKEENRKLFKDLYIEKNEKIMKKQGEYPVIYISLKDLKAETWEEQFQLIENKIASLFREHLYVVKDLDTFSQEDYNKICSKNFESKLLENSLLFLMKVLNKYYDKKVILIIDEYDTPLLSAHEKNYYKKAINFFRGFYGTALKGNIHLEMGILTGIIRVSNENIFSGLNNIVLYSVFEDIYADSFGFTEEEVKKALEYFEIEENISLVKKWYNGYKFGDKEIYNPWSITNYLKNKKVEAYWVNTSGNYLIRKNLSKIDRSAFENLEALFRGEAITEIIDKNSTLNELVNVEDFWKLMLFSGYLTIEKKLEEDMMGDDRYLLRIPNLEIQKFFKRNFLQANYRNNNIVYKMLDAFVEEKFELFENYLQEILEENLSYNDVSSDEKYYHIFILALLIYLDGKYYVKSNRESGFGRYDICLIPKNENQRAFILELKVAKKIEKMDEILDEAMKQIEDKKYFTDLKERGIENITYVAFVFHKKVVKIKYKK